MRSDVHTCYQRDDGGEFTGKDGARWTRRGCPNCGGTGRIALPVPEATLAAQEWVHEQPDGVVWSDAAGYTATWAQADRTGAATGPRGYNGQGPDIFSAIRAALGDK